MRAIDRAVVRRAAGTAAAACVGSTCLAAAAGGVATFPPATNPAGTVAAPYPPGEVQTVRVNVPFGERPAGATPLPALRGRGPADVRVSVPADWLEPTCGGVRRINGTGNTAVDVVSWTCSVEGDPGAAVLHWRPQVGQPPLFGTLAAEQEFTFTVRTPTPAYDTAYGAAGSDAPGFGVAAQYPESIPAEISKAPNAPPDAPGVVAPGLVRAVAGRDGPAPTPTPTPAPTVAPGAPGAPGAQTITAEIPSLLAMTFDPAAVALAAGPADGGHWTFTGALNDVTVTDSRAGGLAWVLSGRTADFTGPGGPLTGSAGYLGWTPLLRDGAPAGVIAGEPVASTLGSPAGPGLATSARLAGADDGHALGIATAGAALSLRLPTGLPGGTYSTTLTLTLI